MKLNKGDIVIDKLDTKTTGVGLVIDSNSKNSTVFWSGVKKSCVFGSRYISTYFQIVQSCEP